jgi:hypothetical protein
MPSDGSIQTTKANPADNIESNITSVAQNTSSAADELTTAHEYQRKAGRRMACLLVILVVVLAVILLAVSRDIDGGTDPTKSRSCHDSLSVVCNVILFTVVMVPKTRLGAP